jgi:hypothetical protein
MSEEWMLRLPQPVPDSKPRVFVEPIAAGEKVVAETRSAVYNFLRAQYSAAVAVETEGRGFLAATRANNVDALVIRGISDLIDSKSNTDAQGSQNLAATRASAFAFQVLSKLEDTANDRSSDPRVGEGSTARTGNLESEKATYLGIIDRQFWGMMERNWHVSCFVNWKPPLMQLDPLLEIVQHYRHFLLFTHDPISTSALLMGATRYAVGQGIVNSEIIPLRLPLERWLTHESLDDLLTIALSDMTRFSSKFISFLHRQIEAGQAFLILEPPTAGDLSSEAISWIRDLTRGVAHNCRLVVLAKFGHNVLDLRKVGFPILIQPYSESEAPNLRLMLRALSSETRDPGEYISGELQISCKIGRSWSIAFKTSDNCYLTIFCRGTTGNLYRLFLDADQSESFIYAKHIYTVPRPGEEFYFKEQGPPERNWSMHLLHGNR